MVLLWLLLLLLLLVVLLLLVLLLLLLIQVALVLVFRGARDEPVHRLELGLLLWRVLRILLEWLLLVWIGRVARLRSNIRVVLLLELLLLELLLLLHLQWTDDKDLLWLHRCNGTLSKGHNHFYNDQAGTHNAEHNKNPIGDTDTQVVGRPSVTREIQALGNDFIDRAAVEIEP